MIQKVLFFGDLKLNKSRKTKKIAVPKILIFGQCGRDSA